MFHRILHDHAVEKSSEKRERAKSDKSSEKPHKSKSSRSKPNDLEPSVKTKTPKISKEKSGREKVKKRVSEPNLAMAEIVVPELSRASSRNSLPYPSFNKEHSKESVHISKHNTNLRMDKPPPTPDLTDFGSYDKMGLKTDEQSHAPPQRGRPPSPPETDIAHEKRPHTRRMSQVKEENEDDKSSITNISLESNSSSDGAQSESFTASNSLSETSKTNKSSGYRESNTVPNSSDESKNKPQAKADQGGSDLDTIKNSSPTDFNTSSDCPKTPIQIKNLTSPSIKDTPSSLTAFETPELDLGQDQLLLRPPTIHKNLPIDTPPVDYLLLNGGLRRHITKKLVAPASATKRSFMPLPTKVEEVFGPCHSLLDHYESVLKKNGSLAVATGYRSVARRLLDRLEVVMGRSLPTEGCLCLMCKHPDLATDEKTSKALGWGEVLEWSSGRKELPVWPTFDFSTLGDKAHEDIFSDKLNYQDHSRSSSPVKMDPDIADEFREYYLKQSKKTRLAVDRWLSGCPLAAATPPHEVDDETLSFSILTHLPNKERPIFNALVTGSTTYQPSNLASVFLRKPRSEFLSKTALSIQRLYRLTTSPRLPEAAIFLLRNPDLHNVLAAVSEINVSEWEILTSGRFDGFLWSGADSDNTNPSHGQPHGSTSSAGSMKWAAGSAANYYSKMMSSTTTFQNSINSVSYNSRDPSKYPSVRRPVLNDEETEIAVLAEVEREIYLGMEALEDAFEALHRKAESVRQALRERGAGLSISLQSRQLSQPVMQNFDTSNLPNSGLGMGYERPDRSESSDVPSDSEWDPGDDFSELAPDDSASNISSSRKRRPKRRNERRAPVLVEEDED
ncbi:putative 5-methylcytosine g t mismatch-specific dna glycosylase [Erysiphe neolycopersici]|uniref:Putative 5-methylcytosine g t mismatch-specific dna glycosylase n=1 Tax=Erysiphe neolycopersici TaxID=212602 RepID=A0A420HC78_9PEZI|nr:putative 5-methylcytosine g t mismatch-specific dna glycosylase [Erysiphe neolycopersici]